MPFTIERNDLAKVSADVIVVTANEGLQINGGVGLSVARAAGLDEMQAACDALGGCPTGQAVATPAFALSADYVVHVVGPVWQGGTQGEEALLRQAYDSALVCADACGAQSIAMPLVSAHTFGFPVRLSFVIAVEAIKAFLENHDDTDVRLVLFGEDAMAVGVSLYDNIAEYIDDHYVEEMQPQASMVDARYFDEQPLQKPPFPARREAPAFGEARYARDYDSRIDEASSREAYEKAHPDAASSDSSARVPYAQSPSAPSAPKRRRGPLSFVGTIIEEAGERLAAIKESKAERPHHGTCVVRDEEHERPEGPYLTPEQYWQIEKNAEAQAWKNGICPHCGYSQIGTRFCPGCGRDVPPEYVDEAQADARADAWLGYSSPAQTVQFAPIVLDGETPGAADGEATIAVDEEALGTADGEAPIAVDEEASAGLHWGAAEPYGDAAESMLAASWESAYEKDIEALPLEASMPAPSYAPTMDAAMAAGPAGGSLTSWLDQIDAPFSTTLLALIDERGLTDAQVYKRANMSRQLFSKIRSDAAYRPTKKTVLALSVALGLDLGETVDLLRRAGFALSHSSKADIIVEYFIVNGNHDIFAINEALYAFDQPLL